MASVDHVVPETAKDSRAVLIRHQLKDAGSSIARFRGGRGKRIVHLSASVCVAHGLRIKSTVFARTGQVNFADSSICRFG